MEPIVSILIPTRNRTDLLVKAVKSALAQSYRSIEIIVTDNSDTDDASASLASIDDTRIHYEKNSSNIGPILNWRKALEIAKGEFCIILPDDDYLINPFYIEDAVNILADSDIQLVVPDCILSYPTKNVIGVSGHIGPISGREFIQRALHVPHIGNMFRRKMALQLNAFHSNDILWSDIELWMKIMSMGNVFCYNKPSILYLFHEDNIVLNMSKSALIVNSRFIRPSVESFASEELIADLVLRYLCSVNSISSAVDREFVEAVLMQNGLTRHSLPFFLKIKMHAARQRAKAYLGKLVRILKKR